MVRSPRARRRQQRCTVRNAPRPSWGGVRERELRFALSSVARPAPSPPQPSPPGRENAPSTQPQASAQLATSTGSPIASGSDAAPSRDFDGDWLKLVSPAAARRDGARAGAAQRALPSWDKGLFKLALPQDKRPLATQKERLAGTLSEYFGRAVKIEIELTDNVGESVAVRDNRVRDESRPPPEAAFMADPAVQVLLSEGGGRVRAGSIQATES